MAVDPNSLEGKYQLLVRQHANLVEAIRHKNEHVQHVEEQVADLSDEKARLEEELLMVNRVMEGLCSDIETMAARVQRSSAPDLGTSGSLEDDGLARYLLRGKKAKVDGNEDASTPSASHPVGGGKLARKNSAQTRKGSPGAPAADRPETPRPDAETEITARSARALASLASLLEAVQGVVAASGEANGAGSADRAAAVAQSLQAVDLLQAEVRSASAVARRYRDECVRLEQLNKGLEDSVQDKQEEVLMLQRKVFKLTKQVEEGIVMNSLAAPSDRAAAGGAGAGPSSAAAAAAAAVAPSSAPAAAPLTGPEGAFQAKILADYRVQVSDLMEQVARLEAELKAQREATVAAKGEAAQALQERETAWETERAALKRQLKDVTAQLACARDEAAVLRTERGLLEQLRAETDRLVAAVEAPSRSMPVEWSALERQLQEQAAILQQRSQSALQLSALNQELTQDLELRREEAERTRIKAEALQAAIEEAQTARQQLAVKEAELSRAVDRLAELEGSSKSTNSREKQLQGRIKELQSFVEVLTTMTGEDMDVTELRAQKKRLEDRVQSLEAQLKQLGGNPAAIGAFPCEENGHNVSGVAGGLSESEREKLKRDRDEALAQLEKVRVELATERASLQETRDRLRSAQSDVEIYMNEMESIATTYDKAQAKNSQLAQKMADHEKDAVQIMQTKLALVKQAAKAAEERDAAKRALDSASGQAMTLAQQLAEATQREAELLGRIRDLEVQRGQDRIENEASLRTEKESWAAERRDLKRKLDKATSEAEDEKSKRRRLQEEKESLQHRVDKLREGKQALDRAVGPPVGDKGTAEEELRSLRRLINCSVCKENPKSVIIEKCMHAFCQGCIQARISSRSRLCPGCGLKFAESDVRPFFFN